MLTYIVAFDDLLNLLAVNRTLHNAAWTCIIRLHDVYHTALSHRYHNWRSAAWLCPLPFYMKGDRDYLADELCMEFQ